MSNETQLVGLHDVRLPPDLPFQTIADLAASVGLGLLLALALAPVLIWLTKPRGSKAELIEAEIQALSDWPEDRRTPALLHLLEQVAPGRARQEFGGDLYAPDALPEAQEIERAIRGAA